MEEVVIPQAMKQVQVEAAGKESPEPASSTAEPDAEVLVAHEAEASHEPIDDISAILNTWRSECDRLAALAGTASSSGPQGDGIDAIKASLSILEDLRSRAARLVPAKVSTAELHQNLQRLTAKAADSLNSLLAPTCHATCLPPARRSRRSSKSLFCLCFHRDQSRPAWAGRNRR
jgi:hypothetical protein